MDTNVIPAKDVDECLEGNGGCEDFCEDTNGSFACLCPNISGTEPIGQHCVGMFNIMADMQ